MKKALAIVALSALALTACGAQQGAGPLPTAATQHATFNTLTPVTFHPEVIQAPVEPAEDAAPVAPVAIPADVAPAVSVPVQQSETAPVQSVQVTVQAPAPVVVVAPAPVVVQAPAVQPVVPVPSPAPCVHKRCGDPSSTVTTEPACKTDKPREACWHHIVVIPEPKEDHK